jgi:hypothetical protein
LATERHDAIVVGARCDGSPAATALVRRKNKIDGEVEVEVREGFTVADDRTLAWPKAGHHLGRAGSAE